MANDSSLAGGAEFAFNLETQKGVMALLAAVRASDISAIEKNELRDLVLSYTNGGHDLSVRITIQQKIQAFGIVPLPVATPIVTAPLDFGASRPAPIFSAPTILSTRVKSTSPSEPVVAASISITPTPQVVESSAPVSITPTPDPVVVPTDPAPQPIVPTKLESVVVESATIAPVSVLSPITLATEQPQTSSTAEQALQRIREIKSLVNDKVGNPVNLVNIDNVVGREYMTALLDAMKKVNSGSSAVTAMQRLETAFQAVEKTIAEHGTEPVKKPKSNPAMAAVSEATPELESLPTTPVAVTTDPVVVPTDPAPQPIITVESTPAPITPVSESVIPQESTTLVSEPIPVTTQVQPAPEESFPASATSLPNESIKAAWGPATDTIKPEALVNHGNAESKVTSLANTKEKLRTPDELLSASDVASSSVVGDPLFTKEVDNGLQQLLSEWSIFKKSGLFGTGPNGREHPLFKKIAPLQIPLLLAGRFEGATQEIKQSITDYMNGWRYEQGIIYEQGETFDHYLRRVIYHILDLQKKKHQP